MKFHHVGIACKNIDEEIAAISKIHQRLLNKARIFLTRNKMHNWFY